MRPSGTGSWPPVLFCALFQKSCHRWPGHETGRQEAVLWQERCAGKGVGRKPGQRGMAGLRNQQSQQMGRQHCGCFLGSKSLAALLFSEFWPHPAAGHAVCPVGEEISRSPHHVLGPLPFSHSKEQVHQRSLQTTQQVYTVCRGMTPETRPPDAGLSGLTVSAHGQHLCVLKMGHDFC